MEPKWQFEQLHVTRNRPTAAILAAGTRTRTGCCPMTWRISRTSLACSQIMNVSPQRRCVRGVEAWKWRSTLGMVATPDNVSVVRLGAARLVRTVTAVRIVDDPSPPCATARGLDVGA